MRQNWMAGLAVSFGVATANAQYCEDVDVVHDGVLNTFDLLAFFQFWGTNDPVADFTDDGIVDGLDLGYQLIHFHPGIDDCLTQPHVHGNIWTVVKDATEDVMPPAGFRAYDVFAQLDDPGDILLNVYDADVGCVGGACFDPNLSYLTIGDGGMFFGFDPNWSMDDFAAGDSFGPGAGWFDIPFDQAPAGLAGLYPDNQVQIARLVMPEGGSMTGHVRTVVYHPEAPIFPLESKVLHFDVPENDCYADFNNDANVNILDYIAFASAIKAEDYKADCNNTDTLDILDFVCFQNMFQDGCD